jgi:hypothetical protein
MQCDLYIGLGGVDYAHQNYQNRVKIQDSWLIIPVSHETKFKPLHQVKINDLYWVKKAADRIQKTFCTKKYKYHNRLWPILQELHEHSNQSLLQLNIKLERKVFGALGLKTDNVLDVNSPYLQKDKTENLVEHVLRYSENPLYYAGSGTLKYLDTKKVPFPIMKQIFRDGVCKDSIVQLIASEPDPADYVANAATWEIV